MKSRNDVLPRRVVPGRVHCLPLRDEVEVTENLFESIGHPIELSPLNVSRKSRFDRETYERLVSRDTVLTRLIRDTAGPHFDQDPDRVVHMYDQIAVASLVDPSLVTTTELYVDVDANQGISYGTSLGAETIWPGAEGAQKMNVQYELDWPRFIDLFIERVSQPVDRD